MIYNDEQKYCFVAIPKTGSKSVTKFLKDNYGGEDLDNYHSYHVPEKFKEENYITFSVVRNPYTRMVSMWYSVAQRKPEDYRLEKFDGLDFESFVEGITDQVPGTRDFFYKTQTEFLQDVDTIIPFEGLPISMALLPFVESVENFPHENATTSVWKDNPTARKPWKEYFTSRNTLNRLNSYYEEDFKKLGYKMITKIEDLGGKICLSQQKSG